MKGDQVKVSGRTVVVDWFQPPHKPSSEGKLTVRDGCEYQEFYVSVIGAEWQEREDRK